MWSRIKEIWNEWGFEITLGLCLLFILIYSIMRIGKKGSWGNYYTVKFNTKKGKRPPRESKGEKECRHVLEELFGKPFPKERPDFLNNPVTGGRFNLELDCYNKDMKLAVEYSGVQHYKYSPFFHKNKEAFLNQKYRDDMKRRICRENGIKLIEVPYTVKNHEIRGFLIKNLKAMNYL